jgi:UDP-glucose:(heptosyl)LPS alpha-1,3-glucosyltransferase
MLKQIFFIRANKTKHGGAEVYLSRLSNELKKQMIPHNIIHSDIPQFLPSWLRVMLFNKKVCSQKKENDLYFSLERVTCPEIYRAGDGVHKIFVDVEQKSKWNPLHKIYISLEEQCFKNSKKIIANSEMIKKQIIDTYTIDSEKIEVVYNGVYLENVNFISVQNKLTNEFKIDFTKTDILLYVGSGFKRKGVEEFLHIISKLDNKNIIAFIVGKEKKLKFYKNIAVALGIENKVIFTGARDDVKDFYAIADIFLFPTRYEPFSNVVLEAMVYQCAIITTKQNGASEILDDEWVMQTSTDYTISTKIDNLLNNKKKLKKLKARNLEIVQNFSIEKNVAETLKVINEVMY